MKGLPKCSLATGLFVTISPQWETLSLRVEDKATKHGHERTLECDVCRCVAVCFFSEEGQKPQGKESELPSLTHGRP